MYRTLIERLAPGYDPRHVEAFLRSEHGTLDHLTLEQFAAEVKCARAAIDDAGPAFAEELACSFGMLPEPANHGGKS